MLRAVIFDFDGVIVDSHPVHTRAWKELFRSLGKRVSDEDLSFVREGARRDEILRKFMPELTDEQVQRYGAEKERLFRMLADEVTPVSGFVEFLEAVETAGLFTGVATSGNRKRVENMLRQFGLLRRFRAIVTGDDVPRGKPDPALFHLTAQALHVDAKNVLVCEDAVAGVEAAKTAGMKCVAIASDGREPMLRAAGADLVAADFAEVSLDDMRGLFVAPFPARP